MKPDEASVDPDEVAKGIKHVLAHYNEMRAKILGKGVQGKEAKGNGVVEPGKKGTPGVNKQSGKKKAS